MISFILTLSFFLAVTIYIIILFLAIAEIELELLSKVFKKLNPIINLIISVALFATKNAAITIAIGILLLIVAFVFTTKAIMFIIFFMFLATIIIAKM